MTTADPSSYWRKCTTCKKPIQFGQKYWICSVSTCNRIRTDLVFCDLRCFDAHVPVLNHRDAGAFEKKAPSSSAQALAQSPSRSSSPVFTSHTGSGSGSVPKAAHGGAQSRSASTPMSSLSSPSKNTGSPDPNGTEILVVVSKVKDYIKRRAGMNTSQSVMDLLTQRVYRIADRAIESANREGRKTVLDRDI